MGSRSVGFKWSMRAFHLQTGHRMQEEKTRPAEFTDHGRNNQKRCLFRARCSQIRYTRFVKVYKRFAFTAPAKVSSERSHLQPPQILKTPSGKEGETARRFGPSGRHRSVLLERSLLAVTACKQKLLTPFCVGKQTCRGPTLTRQRLSTHRAGGEKRLFRCRQGRNTALCIVALGSPAFCRSWTGECGPYPFHGHNPAIVSPLLQGNYGWIMPMERIQHPKAGIA